MTQTRIPTGTDIRTRAARTGDIPRPSLTGLSLLRSSAARLARHDRAVPPWCRTGRRRPVGSSGPCPRAMPRTCTGLRRHARCPWPHRFEPRSSSWGPSRRPRKRGSWPTAGAPRRGSRRIGRSGARSGWSARWDASRRLPAVGSWSATRASSARVTGCPSLAYPGSPPMRRAEPVVRYRSRSKHRAAAARVRLPRVRAR